MIQYNLKFDLKTNVDHSDQYFTSSNFVLYFEKNLFYEHHT